MLVMGTPYSSTNIRILILFTMSFLPQWKPGQDVPISWKEYYSLRPCVPVDYSSVEAALTCATRSLDLHYKAGSSRLLPTTYNNITVYLRPGRYYMDKAVTIKVACHSHRITIETMELPEACRQSNAMNLNKSKTWEQRAI